MLVFLSGAQQRHQHRHQPWWRPWGIWRGHWWQWQWQWLQRRRRQLQRSKWPPPTPTPNAYLILCSAHHRYRQHSSPFLSADSCLFPITDINYRLSLRFGDYLLSFVTPSWISFPAPVLTILFLTPCCLGEDGLLQEGPFRGHTSIIYTQEEPLLGG